MTEKPIDLDRRRGLSAQRATESRRLISEVEAHEAELHRRRAEAEEQLLALPAASWEEAAVKARYLLRLYAETLAGGDARTKRLIAAVLEDFERLSNADAKGE
ncbi:MAG: hypothetical protein ACM3II_15060 [Rhodospirillaceae bacterium]